MNELMVLRTSGDYYLETMCASRQCRADHTILIKTVTNTELQVSKEWNLNEQDSVGSVFSIILWHCKHSLATGMAWRAR